MTINGKNLNVIFEELSKPKAYDDVLQKKFPYRKIKTYMERITSVVGQMYSFTVIDSRYERIASDQEVLVVHGRLSLLSDDGAVVLQRDAMGGYEIAYNDAGKQAGLKNSYNNACTAAFKACWNMLGIFGETGDEPSVANSPKSRQTPQQSQTKQTLTEKMFEVSISSITIERTDERSGKPVYKSISKAGQTIIFYPNQYLKVVDEFNRLLSSIQSSPSGLKVKIMAKEKSESLIFTNFA